MRKKGIFVLILLVIGVIGYNYLYQDHRNINGEKPVFDGSVENFIGIFSSGPEIAEMEYLDKTIQVYGTISELNNTDLTLNDAVFCQFDSALSKSLRLGDTLSIKGRCIGYDDLLEQVKLNECSIIKK